LVNKNDIIGKYVAYITPANLQAEIQVTIDKRLFNSFFSISSIIAWQPPPVGVTKINASVNKSMGWIGIHVVARDYQGCFFGRTMFYPENNDRPTWSRSYSNTSSSVVQ